MTSAIGRPLTLAERSDSENELQSQPPGGHVGHEYQPNSNPAQSPRIRRVEERMAKSREMNAER